MGKKLSKYIAAFNYFDKAFIALSEKVGGVSIISFANVILFCAGITNASLILLFSLATGIIKKFLQITRNKKKSREECKTISNEKEKYEGMKKKLLE